MNGEDPACGWSEHTFPCHGYADPKGFFFHHPEGAKCKTNEKVGENGCTWKASPLMHTLSVQQLQDAGSIGGQPTHWHMQIEEELENVQRGLQAFTNVGASPCGPTPSPVPPSGPSPVPPQLSSRLPPLAVALVSALVLVLALALALWGRACVRKRLDRPQEERLCTV